MNEKYEDQLTNQGIVHLQDHMDAFEESYYGVLDEFRVKKELPYTKEEAFSGNLKTNDEAYSDIRKKFIKAKTSQSKKRKVEKSEEIAKKMKIEEKENAVIPDTINSPVQDTILNGVIKPEDNVHIPSASLEGIIKPELPLDAKDAMEE